MWGSVAGGVFAVLGVGLALWLCSKRRDQGGAYASNSPGVVYVANPAPPAFSMRCT
jgi:hypothetical protein